MNDILFGNNNRPIAYLLVSETFCNEAGFDIWSSQETTADMRFSNTQNIAEITSDIESSLKLSSGQALSVNPDLLDGNINFQTIAVCIILGLGIVLCGYLLIYNVFYISVSNDVQFYGQLRTIGTTSRQIGKIISRQAMKIACFGIIAGLLGSFALSIFFIPFALLGITACLVVTLLIQSMSTDNFINSAMEHDIELTNQTLVLGYRGGQEQLFDENFITELYSIADIGDISLQREQTIIPEYSEDMFYPYILDKYQSQGMEAPGVDYYDQYPNRFYTQLVSIDAEKLKDYIVEKGMDYEGFYNGDYGLLAADKPELFPSNQVVRFQCGHISEFEAVAGGDLLELPIGGFLPSSYYGGLSTDAPYIFVSEAAMERISPDAYISWLGIDVNSASEKRVASSVRELCNQAGAISLTSKAELADGLHSAKITLYTLGGGIAFVLAFIGIINFANIMFTNIEARRHELSVMESIGMTKKQCRRMLQMEGFWYAVMSLALCLTAGNVLLLGVFQAFKVGVEYAVFSYPIWMMLALTAILLAFCWFIPLMFVNRMMKSHQLKD